MRCESAMGTPKPTIHKSTPTPQELHAALKLIELLYVKGDIPQHVYRNICADYYGNDINLSTSFCHFRQEAI